MKTDKVVQIGFLVKDIEKTAGAWADFLDVEIFRKKNEMRTGR